MSLFKKLLKNKKVIGVKNSSMPVMDIERFKSYGGEDFILFNGPDEQYVSGRLIGADGGIGGTYAVMPELFLKAEEFVVSGHFHEARKIQSDINDIIIALCSLNASMYAVIKGVLKLNGIHIGSVRSPMEPVSGADLDKIRDIQMSIEKTVARYGG